MDSDANLTEHPPRHELSGAPEETTMGEGRDRPGEHRNGVGDDHHDEAEEAVVRRLQALADEPLPAATRQRHLARLRGTAGAETRPVGVPTGGRGRVPRRLVPVLAALLALLLVGSGGAVAAAQDATPDHALYGVKRASEQVWVALPLGSEQAARVQLQLAMRRHDEAIRAPRHAEQLLAAGATNAERAADELPEEAFEAFQRLLGDGEESLPEQASPMARAAIHRNCLRLAERHDLDATRCGEAPDVDHPGRRGLDRADGEHPGRGPEGERPGWGPEGRPDGERPGWGPQGRPDDHVGPPPWAPGSERADPADGDPDGETTD